MYSGYAKFWMDVLYPDRKDSITLFQDAEFDASEFTSSVLKVYENAESCGCLTEDLACQYVSFCLKLERLEEAKNLAEKLCNGPLSNAAKLWCLRASMEINSCATDTGSPFNNEHLSSLFNLFNTVLPKLSITETEGLWHMVSPLDLPQSFPTVRPNYTIILIKLVLCYLHCDLVPNAFQALKLFSNEKIYLEKLVKCAMLSLTSARGDDCGASVSSAIVGWFLQRGGMKRARKMYKRYANCCLD
jgi:U3 small nucleolar RNA-associated protein 6